MNKSFLGLLVIPFLLMGLISACSPASGFSNSSSTEQTNAAVNEGTTTTSEAALAANTGPSTETNPSSPNTLISSTTPNIQPGSTNQDTCLQSELVSETIPEGTSFTAGEYFTKTWQLKNTGTCTWDADFRLEFQDGSRLGEEDTYKLNATVPPGQTVDITIPLRAPNAPGTFSGDWLMRSTAGILFGWGTNASRTLRVTIKSNYPNSPTVTPTPVSTPGRLGLQRYDFIDKLCDATWESGDTDKKVFRQCGDIDYAYAWALRVEKPVFEENRTESEPALWLHPEEGYVQGTYPEYTVKYGDTFRSYVGCPENYGDCKVTFQLSYQLPDNTIVKLKEWKEVYDGKIALADVDLNPLAGKNVKFILSVRNDGNQGQAHGYWLRPRIMGSAGPVIYWPTPTSEPEEPVYIAPPVATLTPSRTPTSTMTLTPSKTGTPTMTFTPSKTGTPTMTAPPSLTFTATNTSTPTGPPTRTATATSTPTITIFAPTLTSTYTATATITVFAPTLTSTYTPTATIVISVPTQTHTHTPTATNLVPTPTDTLTPTP